MRDFLTVLKNEYRYIFSDWGVMLILFGAIVIYSTAYAFAYNNEVLRDVPVAVVDLSKSSASREFIRKIDATPNVVVSRSAQSLEDAKEQFLRREVSGVVVIERDFETKIARAEKAFISVYADASYFLVYKQVFLDVVEAMNYMNNQIEVQRFEMSGLSSVQARAVSDPVKITSKYLFNPAVGYASFVMPAVLVLIIQQTLLIGIGMIGGTWHEQNLYSKFSHSTLPLVLGKAVVYISLSVLTMLFVFGFQYKNFGYPMNGSAMNVVAFFLPYVLSVVFLGITLSSLFTRRENSLLILLFTSIPFLMISGVSIPAQAMPGWLYEAGKAIPSSAAINGFIRVQSMGATLKDVAPELINLWILSGFYFFTACLGMKFRTK